MGEKVKMLFCQEITVMLKYLYIFMNWTREILEWCNILFEKHEYIGIQILSKCTSIRS